MSDAEPGSPDGMSYTVEQLKAWAAEGVEQWQASMPPGVTFGVVVPDADAVFFTVIRGNEGSFIQVPAGKMNSPETWASAAASMLDAVHRDQLRPLEDGQVPLMKLILPQEEIDRPREAPTPIDLHALLPDPAVREIVLAELAAGVAELEERRTGLWYLNPAFGPEVLVRQLHVDGQGRLVARSDA